MNLRFALILALIALPAFAADKDAPQKSAAPAPGLLQPGSGEQLDITADNSLEWNETTRIYTARGNAKAKRGDVLIEADTLQAYDRKKADGSSEVWKMTAKGNVKISSKDNTATGDEGVYDIDTKKAVLTGDHLELITPTDHVTAKKSLEYWETEQVAIASGDAEAVRDGRRVRSDEMIAYLKTDAKGQQNIDRMQATGNVHITTATDNVTCDQVTYNLAANSAILQGHVSITQGSNQLRGDRVETDFKTGKSKLVNSGSGRVHALIGASNGPKGAKSTKASATSGNQSLFMKP